VAYRDRLIWAMQTNSFQDHAQADAPSTAYVAKGDIDGMKPDARWAKEESAIRQVLGSTLPDTAFNRIKTTANVHDAWEILKRVFEERSKALVADLIRKFRNKRCNEDESVRSHFESLANLREQLAAIGKAVTDEDYTDTLLASLPHSYDSSISSISASARLGSKVLTAEIFEQFMIDESERRRVKNEHTEARDEALAADIGSGKGKDRRKDKRKVECYNCHKTGHYKSECWAKGGGKEGQGPRRGKGAKEDANAAPAEEEQDQPEAWAAMEEIPALAEASGPEAAEAVTAAAGHPTARADRGQPKPTTELYDSGASRHMSPFGERFTNYRTIPPRPITAADKRIFYAVGTGDLRIEVPNGESFTPIVLKDVLHAPDMGVTIVSINRITKAGYTVFFDHECCRIRDEKRKKHIGNIPVSITGLYKVERVYAAATKAERVDLATLHKRLAHIAPHSIRQMISSGALEGVELTDDAPMPTCQTCEQAKATRKQIRKEREAPLADAVGAEIHSDLWGPSPIPSLGGRRYYVTFTDDYSRHTSLTVLRTKGETLEAYKAYAAWMYTQHGVRVKRLRSDRGGEYTGNEFSKFLAEQGTERRLTTHDTPQHNGVAESLNRRLMERVRACIIQSELPKALWAEAANFVIWVKNRTTTKVLGNVTPQERLTGRKPNLAGLPEWGQRVWVHIGDGSKLEARAWPGRWVGYDSGSTHAHRIYWPDKHGISVERDVRFTADFTTVYTSAPPLESASQLAGPAAPAPAPPAPSTPAPSTPAAPASPPPATSSGEEELEVEDELEDGPGTPPAPRGRGGRGAARRGAPAPQPTRQSTRLRKPSALVRRIEAGEGTAGEELAGYAEDDEDPSEWANLAGFEDVIAATIQEVEGDPKTVQEARSRSDWPHWKEAMDREIGSLEHAGTWTTVPRPAGRNIVGCKWVFRLKRKADGSVDKYKARLVARGFTQIYGVDYYDTYSPVARLASFRLILAVAARNDWDVEAFDFNSAYLNGELDADEEIYMQEPPGYESGEAGSVKRLLKALYGLKQAGRKWYDALRAAVTDLGFRVTKADPGVFTARIEDDVLILAVHVDDCAMTGSSPKLILLYKEKLNARYALTDLGEVSWLLGIQVTHDCATRSISLSQKAYIESIIARFSLADAKAYSTPMVPSASYSKADSPASATEAAHMRKVPYREAIGSLMYASVATRPDITFAVSTLSQFLENPGEAHWEAVKRVFRYLSGTRDVALTYGGERHDLLGFTDADGASQEHRRAISGHAFIIDGGAVSWSSRKQELVTLSTAEAEYVAATHAAKEGIWLRRVAGEILLSEPEPMMLYCDNQAALKLAQDDNYHARTKHIDIRYHFIRDVVQRGLIELQYCPTDDMTADILTKALPRWKVSQHALGLGLRRPCGGVMEMEEAGAPGVEAERR
jgi:transposase InsO family protein